MAGWKILVTDGLDGSGLSLLNASAQVDDRTGINAEELLQVVGDYDALIVRSRTKVTGAIFQAALRLKVIGRAGVGVDNIDLEAARLHGVSVVNAPVSTTTAVAELTLGLMFALARRIPQADAALKAGKWLKKELEGAELSGKTIGVVGMGNIGRGVAERAAALGMQVLGYDPLLTPNQIQSRGAEPASLEVLYQLSDFITLHVPLTAETRSMIGPEAIQAMRPGVYLVCAARGGLIDEEALLQALESGRVAGAALDVFGKEPPDPAGLIRHPRLIATPHIGAQTAEAQVRASQDIASEVLAALNGQPLRWQVA